MTNSFSTNYLLLTFINKTVRISYGSSSVAKPLAKLVPTANNIMPVIPSAYKHFFTGDPPAYQHFL